MTHGYRDPRTHKPLPLIEAVRLVSLVLKAEQRMEKDRNGETRQTLHEWTGEGAP